MRSRVLVVVLGVFLGGAFAHSKPGQDKAGGTALATELLALQRS